MIIEWFSVTPEVLAILFVVALLAGFIDSIAGGGGLLTVPALLAVGIPPAQALATNKLQAMGGSFSASLYFVRRKAVNLASMKGMIALTFVGAVTGSLLVQHINTELLRHMLPFLVISIGIYFLVSPKIGAVDGKRRLSPWPFAMIGGGCLGFYDGFFGPGAGSFYALAFVTLCGFNLAKATAHAKVLNFTSNLGGLLFFIVGGKVLWALGLVMLLGQVIGARMGAHMVLTKGQSMIRPMLVIVSFVMSSKLLYDNYGSLLH